MSSQGDPRGFVNGKLSKDYNALFQSPLEEQVISGPAIPRTFGSIRNTFQWKGISLSFNIIYRLGYYFQKNSLGYYSLFKYGKGDPEYAERWQKPGDEKLTNVPSLEYPVNLKRNSFYQQSDVNVLRADNIKLNDFRISYRPSSCFSKLSVENIELFAYVYNTNIMLWKANKLGLDPDFPSGLKTPVSISLGVKANF